METLELILLLLAAVLASSVIVQLLPKFPVPLIQIILGVFIELLTPDSVSITFDTDFFLVAFIAPLLYDEARNIDKAALMRNIKPVLGLAIGLVLVIILAIGGVVHWLIPAIPFAAACMLGAALGPTDAVAVNNLPKDAELGDRRRQILQGESLLNDASGIVGFQFALLVITTGTFSVLSAAGTFLLVFFGGLAIGAVLGLLANVIERYLRNIGVENTTFHVLFDISLPFIIYLFADTMGVSGIIAVVVSGLIRSLDNKGITPSASRLTIVSQSVWQTLSFALNGIVFVLLGTQLPRAMDYTSSNPSVSTSDLLLWILVITIVLMAVRFLWVFVTEFVREKRALKKRGEGAESGEGEAGEASASTDIQKATSRYSLVKDTAYSALLMTLAGPKGAVTLAMIFSIPVLLDSTSFFPERSLIIFISSGVILLTLLLSSIVLPLLAPKADTTEEERKSHERDTETTVEILRNVIQELMARQNENNSFATDQVIAQYNQRITNIRNDTEQTDSEGLELRLAMLERERNFVQSEIAAGSVEPLIGYRYINRVDHRENILLHQSERINIRNLFNEAKEFIRGLWYGVKRRVLPNSAEQEDRLRSLQMKAYRNVIAKLRHELSQGTYPTETVSQVLMEYRRGLARTRAEQQREKSTMSNVATAVTNAAAAAATGQTGDTAQRRMSEVSRLDEVAQIAVSLELDAINEAYDEGRLSRIAAKRMRENASMMQFTLTSGD